MTRPSFRSEPITGAQALAAQRAEAAAVAGPHSRLCCCPGCHPLYNEGRTPQAVRLAEICAHCGGRATWRVELQESGYPASCEGFACDDELPAMAGAAGRDLMRETQADGRRHSWRIVIRPA